MKLFTILLTVFALESCGNAKATANMQDNIDTNQTEILSGKYLISSLLDTEKLPEDVFLDFDSSTNRISGFAGCNRFSGEYTTDGNRIEIGTLISTKMYCEDYMDVESNLLKKLEKANSFSIENNTLALKKDTDELIVATKNTSAKISQGDDYTIEYVVSSRGSYKNIKIKDNSLVYQKDRGSKSETRTFDAKESSDLLKKVEVLELVELQSLESPTKAHQYDGAPGATLKITKDGITYQTQTFDHGKPNATIEDLVSTILKMAEKQ